VFNWQLFLILDIILDILILRNLVWCPGQNKRIAPLPFFH
jgi:hypothetical protein